MIHALYRPRAPLDRLVDFFWISDEDYIAQAPRERVLPTGSQALVVHLGQSPMRIYAGEHAIEPANVSDAVVCGARSSPLIIGATLGPTVGVHFKPGRARRLFDVPADALAEQTASLEALWGASACSLRERLLEALTPRERVHFLENFLLERVRSSFEVVPTLRAALDAFEEPDLTSVAEVNRRTGLSPKRLLALFRDEVGLNPKAFWRVRRFRAALRGLERGASSGAALAADTGYFDQAHFDREFHRLAGLSPREYLAARGEIPNHVPMRR